MNVINENLIFLDKDFTKKKDLLRFVADEAEKGGYVKDAQAFLEAVLKREEEVPTAIGYGIAIPHGKTDNVNQPFIAFLRTDQLFTWTEGYDDEVQLVFLIGVPETKTEKLHLKFISEISKKLLDEEFRKELLALDSPAKIYQLLNQLSV